MPPAACCRKTSRIRRPTPRSIPADIPILTLALTSDTLPLEQVNDLADTKLAQKLSQVLGVGLVNIQGNQKPAVRVRINPPALAALGLGIEDVRNVLVGEQRQRAEGELRRQAPGLRHRRE